MSAIDGAFNMPDSHDGTKQEEQLASKVKYLSDESLYDWYETSLPT